MNTRAPIEGQLADQPPAAAPAGAVVAYQDRPPSSNPFDAAPAQFAVQIRERGENYANLVAWLCEHMVVGEDLVQVHIVKRDKCDPRNSGCSPSTNPYHWSDPTLSKKGAEKVCGLLGIGVRFLGMEDFRRMALKGTHIVDIIIDCELYNGRNETISQGTGACNIAETQDNLNNALKKACKRAHVDAVLRVAGLSGIATEIKRRMPPIDLERAKEGLPQRQPAGSVDERAEVARGGHNTGAKLTHCPIGAAKGYKGKPWREVPSDFLEWIVRDIKDKPDICKAAAGELEKRRGNAPAGSDSTHTRPPPSSRPEGTAPGRSPMDPAMYPFDDEVPF
jgi:hypothetical protein